MSNHHTSTPLLRRIMLLLVPILIGVTSNIIAPSAAQGAPLSTLRVQWNLAAMSYMPYSETDGVNGPKTTAAVKKFQADQCLSVDGVVGPATDARLQAVMRQIQAKVGVSQDGAAGPTTKQAIINYQSRHGLTADGYAGPATFAKMGIKRTCTPSGGAAPIVQPISNPSDKVACASGTRDLGATNGYYSGKAIKVRLCAIPGFSSTGLESTPGHRYYISGANRETIVNSRVSGAVRDMFAAAKRSGVTLKSASSFRSHQHQQDLWRANPNSSKVARPGTSAHQGGLALDLRGVPGFKSGATCTNRATASNNAQYTWMRNNAIRFGFRQYAAEAWHWDVLPLKNRC